MRRAALLVTIALGAASPARAAYDPQLDVHVDPAAPGAAAALTATVTQAPGEAATRSERVRFPPQFAFNPDFHVTGCSASDEHAGNCPEDSRIGSASAQTMFGDFAGPVFLTSDFRLVVFLRGFAGLVQQEISGYLLLEPDGSVVSVLEDLPDVPSTLARVAFDGGPRSLILTPRTCGTYELTAQFTSHDDDRVERRVPVQIAGCDSTPRIERAAVAAGRRSARLSWQLSDAGQATLVEIQRIVRTRRFVRWRRVSQLRASAARGANGVTLALPRAGRYQVVLTTLSARGRPVDVRRVPFRRA
jgi:hypothetical protein